jgi:2Fe-2S ferredoxin
MFHQGMTNKFIHFLPIDRKVPIDQAESVLEVALRNGIPLNHSCGGMGSCTTCRVIVQSSSEALPVRNELEQDLAEMRGFADNERLACQLPALGDLVVCIPPPLDLP